MRVYADEIAKDGDGLRLRAEMMARLCAAHFKPADVAILLAEVLQSEDDTHIGPLKETVAALSLEDAMGILDAMPQPDQNRRSGLERRNVIEIVYLLDDMLIRVLDEAKGQVYGSRLWRWLRARRRLTEESTYSSTDGLKEALTRHPDVLRKTVSVAVAELVIDDKRWRFVHRLRQATLHVIDEDNLLQELVLCVAVYHADRAKQTFLYELAVTLSFRPTERAHQAFVTLEEMTNSRPDLEEVLTRNLFWPLEDWRKQDAERRAKSVAKTQERRARDAREFAQSRNAISRSAHYGWMAWLGELYLGRFNNVDSAASPRERIATELGDENAQTALEGLVALAFRTDLPRLADIVETLSADKYYPWWVAIVAGLDEASSQDCDMGHIANSTLQAALVIGTERLIFSEKTDERRRWKRSFLDQHPELARDAYLALVRSHLSRQRTHIDGLHPLLSDAHLASFRKDVSLLLLREFPNCAVSALEDLLEAALATSDAHTELLELSEHVLSQDGVVGAEQRLLWLAAAYLLDPTSYEPQISACGSDMVWKLRDLSGTDHRRHNKAGYSLSVRQLAFMAAFTAGYFVNTDHPKDGWSGNQNPWDGAEYVRSLVTQISTVPTAKATDALIALEQMTALESYSDQVKHALANQRARRRDVEYRQPDWPQTVRTLKNGGPASSGDLHALVLAHLEDTKARITGSNTDVYKRFWERGSPWTADRAQGRGELPRCPD